MRVALVVPSIGSDEAIQTPAVSVLARALARSVDLHVFAIRNPATGVSRLDGMSVHALGGGTLRTRVLLATAISRLRQEHHRRPFDLIHALWLHEPGTVAIAAGRLLRLPVVASIGGAEVAAIPAIGYGTLLSRRGSLLTRLVLRRADAVTGGSRYVLGLARAICPEQSGRLLFAPLPIDARQFAPPTMRRAIEPSAPRLLHAASLIPVKDQRTLLSAFQRVATAIPDARLAIYGEDPFGRVESLRGLAGERGIERAVTFGGALQHTAMAAVYHDADILLHSSLHESQGLAVLEAASCGVPTAGTAVGVVPDLAPDAAVAVPPGDPDSLAARVIDLARQPDQLTRMGKHARERIVREYDVGPGVERFLDLYRELTGRRR